MNQKTFIWGGLFIGSTVGGMLPNLWGSNMLSMSSVILTAVGGVLGIWIGLKLFSGLGL
ncbi:hypothetical protein MNBD_CPR01-266 [hydrothermal vent metagenome]|uniref:Uncharacterized protein n=1 Tax=hydrothermal vent metagenome TaxID=652676 RepID=A0A3B0V1N7_9ZZZZ